MSFGKNLQYLRHIRNDLTQEALAEKLDVSRQTVSKWESDAAMPEIEKALELCGVYNCSLDNLFRDDLGKLDAAYTNLRTEALPAFRFIRHAVISNDPESDAIAYVRGLARQMGVEQPRIIGWDFPYVSIEQSNVYHMHGYEAAWVLPEGVEPEGQEIIWQPARKYAAIHIARPFDNPFVTIPGAYRALDVYMQVNGLRHSEKNPISCFETDGESMDVYIVCE